VATFLFGIQPHVNSALPRFPCEGLAHTRACYRAGGERRLRRAGGRRSSRTTIAPGSPGVGFGPAPARQHCSGRSRWQTPTINTATLLAAAVELRETLRDVPLTLELPGSEAARAHATSAVQPLDDYVCAGCETRMRPS